MLLDEYQVAVRKMASALRAGFDRDDLLLGRHSGEILKDGVSAGLERWARWCAFRAWRALEAIWKLIVIGAFNRTLVAGLGSSGGGPSIALPELQRPTSLSVQVPGGSTPKLTMPSGSPNPAAKPAGPRTKIRVGGDPDNARSDIRENESADAFAREGYKVEQNPPRTASGKKPDYRIEGEYVDNYAPKKETTPRSIWTTAKGKVDAKQAFRLILNLDDWGGDVAALQRQFNDWPITDLIEVFIVKGGKGDALLAVTAIKE